MLDPSYATPSSSVLAFTVVVNNASGDMPSAVIDTESEAVAPNSSVTVRVTVCGSEAATKDAE
ncbi:MAG: Uncharacterised protein [Chloroflexota bacterium]|nr:MAG: Uncharacterised protein [Chloroflexota bacterium]